MRRIKPKGQHLKDIVPWQKYPHVTFLTVNDCKISAVNNSTKHNLLSI